MVDDVLANAVGLVLGAGTAQVLGDYAESKIKPGITVGSTTQDKLIARVANNGPKLALAYGIYAIGKTSPFLKNVAMGAILSTIVDEYWRYVHNGVPYSGCTPAPTTPAPTSSTPVTPAPTTPAPTSSTSSGQSPGEPDIGLLDNAYNNFLISDFDTLENIIEKGRILEEM